MDYKVTDTELTSVANAIRTKGGTSGQLVFPTGFVSAIGDISGGGSATKNILSGTDMPFSNLGDDGDIYLMYYDSEGFPSGYAPIEWLPFQSGKYVDLGISRIGDKYIELKVNDKIYLQDKHWLSVFTTYNSKYYWRIGNSDEASGGTWVAGEHVLKYNKGDNHEVILDDAILGSGIDIDANDGLLIGKRGGSANASNFDVAYCRAYDKSTGDLLRDCIPVIRTDHVLGMYDFVGKTFYSLDVADTSIDVASNMEIIGAYVKVNGAWQILTGSNINDVNTGN